MFKCRTMNDQILTQKHVLNILYQMFQPRITIHKIINHLKKPTRSLSVTDLNAQYEISCQSNIQQKPQPLSMTKENASCRVADWITNLDINKE
ncbi:unnamed protein product [Caenorhabditis angaria]|uniref:Uncharacterized protein n=1 Tax=Caenorhabditis angaria TaxID=860376 RepID=A0A9P1J2C3_9PELO|nr:unnamed protein product [Caenorhabditis angaria]